METPDSYGIEFIEKYLSGQLKGEELAIFERQIQDNPELAARVDHVRHLPDYLFTIEQGRLAEQAKLWAQEDRSQEGVISVPEKESTQAVPKKQSGRLKQILIGLAAVAAILWGIWYIAGSKSDVHTMSKQYMAQHYQKPVVLRGETDEVWKKAITAYEQDGFAQMIDEMNPWIHESDATTEQLFYYALAHIYTTPAEYDKALDLISDVERRDVITYAEEIAWFRGLIYIQQERLDAARSELEKITRSNRYGVDAQRLIELLDQ